MAIEDNRRDQNFETSVSHRCPIRPPGVVALLADAVFKFPNSEGGEQKRFGPGEGAGGGHGMFAIMTVGAVTWASCFFAGFSFAHGSGGRAGDVKVAAVHN